MLFSISTVLSLLFPLSQDEKNIQNLTPKDFLLLYRIQTVHDVYALSSFKETAIRSALHLNKFHNHTHAQKLLGALFEKFLNEHQPTRTMLIVPVPLSAKRKRERGHNQVTSVISRCATIPPRYKIHEDILIKTRHTQPQTAIDKTKRENNLHNAYACTQKASMVTGAHIVLIDDVITTGATLLEAKRTLEKLNPASITCVAFAH